MFLTPFELQGKTQSAVSQEASAFFTDLPVVEFRRRDGLVSPRPDVELASVAKKNYSNNVRRVETMFWYTIHTKGK